MSELYTRDSYVEGIEVRQAEGQPSTMGGYAAVFGQEAVITEGSKQWRERIARGAFDQVVGRDNVIAAVNHDYKQVLGRTSNKTLTLSVDAHGLRYQVQLPNTSVAHDTMELVRNGTLTGSSFKFAVDTDGIRVIERAKNPGDLPLIEIANVKRLVDVGPVIFPAYEGTSVGVRMADTITALFAEQEREAERMDAEKNPSVKAREAARARVEQAKAWAA